MPDPVTPSSSTGFPEEKPSRILANASFCAALSEKLDEADPIEQNYYLEVSSPGLDRTLLREKDFVRFAGHPVEVSLYKGIDGKKHYTGELVGWQDGNLVLIGEKGVTLSFPEEAVAKTKLLVIF